MATPIDVDGALLDTCGTGGDGLATFNISTLSAIVAAACGARVAKHGNRAASSMCGSADVLEQLGVKIDLAPEGVARCIDEAGIGFLFAPIFHPSFRFAGVPRRSSACAPCSTCSVRCAIPAGARYQALGVADGALAGKMADVLHAPRCRARDRLPRGRRHGRAVGERRRRTSSRSTASARSTSSTRASSAWSRRRVDAMRGGGPEENARIAREVLGGAKGPRRDVVLLNAAAALRAAGLAKDWKDGIGLAAEAIDSGRRRRGAGAVGENLAGVSPGRRTSWPAWWRRPGRTCSGAARCVAQASSSARAARYTPKDFAGALRAPGLAVIAEMKQRTPSMGVLAEDYRPGDLARAYADGRRRRDLGADPHGAASAARPEHLDAARAATDAADPAQGLRHRPLRGRRGARRAAPTRCC